MQTKKITEKYSIFVVIADAISVILAFYLAGYLRHGWKGLLPEWSQSLPNLFISLIILVAIWPLILYYYRLYEQYELQSFFNELFNILKSIAIIAFFIFAAVYALKLESLSRLVVGYFLVLLFLFTSTIRITIRSIITYLRSQGYSYRNILIVGAGKNGKAFARQILSKPELGYKIIGYVDDNHEEALKKYNIPFLGPLKEIETIICNKVVDEIIVTLPYTSFNNIKRIIAISEEQGKTVRIVMDFIQTKITKGTLNIFEDLPILSIEHVPKETFRFFIKRLFDIIFSFLVLVLFLPFFVIISLLIKITSPGPIFFKQERVGLNGRKFLLYKFRSMVVDAESRLEEIKHLNEQDGPVFKIKNDPRITKIGKILRKTSLDEFPQFINVLKGDMSIVGPRPPLPQEVEKYDAWHRRRLSIKPGITCLWQVSGRNNIPFEKWMELDMQYIDSWSLLLDFKIIFKTFMTVINMNGR